MDFKNGKSSAVNILHPYLSILLNFIFYMPQKLKGRDHQTLILCLFRKKNRVKNKINHLTLAIFYFNNQIMKIIIWSLKLIKLIYLIIQSLETNDVLIWQST